MIIVPEFKLIDSDDDIVLWNGSPFTGTSYEQEQGKVQSAGGFWEGEPHGPQRVWHPSGHLAFERYFYRWRRHGPYREWNARGALCCEIYHNRGILVREQRWSSSGDLEYSSSLAIESEDAKKLSQRRTEMPNAPVIDIDDWQMVERPEDWGSKDLHRPPAKRPKPPRGL